MKKKVVKNRWNPIPSATFVDTDTPILFALFKID